MERKEFIKSCGWACLSVTSMAFLLQSCASSNYFAKASTADNQIIIKKSEFLNPGTKTSERPYVLVKSDKNNFPICIYKTGDDSYSALLLECTHKGCELQPHGDYLVCPCHGSEFSNKGVVQNPPAEENLKEFIIKTDHENIYIQL